MKRLFFTLAVALATVCCVQAAQVSEAMARQVANRFFSAQSPRLTASSGQSATRLAYTADNDRFYVFDRGQLGGFVVVAGDDRLPQVLGYGDHGDFSAAQLPPAMRYWMDAMDKQIAFIQANDNVPVHMSAPRAAAVAPLLTTQWDQGSPYNNYCPTFDTPNGGSSRAVTGCVATATAQVMNYHKWPEVGQGSHSYVCNVNETTTKELSADFSQSVYRWDLMLDSYDDNSNAESIDAVARLMSDVGISMDMGYGSSSGASEVVALQSLKRYFKYSDKAYILDRDYYNAEEWDQVLVDEISARRPVLYCGYDMSTNGGGHAFVLDGFNTDGYFHVNWGWGGYCDGYFVVSLLAPYAGINFKFMQDGFFGLVPNTRSDEVEDVLYIRSQLLPTASSAALGSRVAFTMDNFMAQGNMLDTAGYEERNGRKLYYALIPMSLGIYDENNVELKSERFSYQLSLDPYWYMGSYYIYLNLPTSLEDGDYRVRLFYSTDDRQNYDHEVLDFSGKDLYVKMQVRDGIAYLTDCFLYNTYAVESFTISSGATVGQPFTVDVKLLYPTWRDQTGPAGNVYLSLLKDGTEVATSEMCEVQLQGSNAEKTYQMQITAPSQWGLYDLVLNDESGNQMMQMDGWYGSKEISESVFVLPVCQALVEDFESMTPNSSTTDKNVQGQFTTWSFYKSGVRSPGEGLCNGSNAVMMKKPSYVYSTQPVGHNFILAQAAFFNPSSTVAKYTLEYSLDNGTSWQRALTLANENVAEVPEKGQTIVTWMLNLTVAQPATFRISMIGGGSSATYVDDISFYYADPMCDVNGDGEVNIADVNAVIDAILSNPDLLAADVNSDGEINVSDINIIIDMMLAQ